MSDFEAFYRANVRLVYALALSRTADAHQADDLTQDTFIRAWEHFHQLSGSKPPQQRAWLIRTLRNLATDEWRREQLASTAPLDNASSSEQIAQQTDLRLDLAQALAALDEPDRDLVIMRYLEDMNSREIGEALGMPEGTVRRRLAQCRSRLAERLSQWAPQRRTE